jgi:antitoxin PrlF
MQAAKEPDMGALVQETSTLTARFQTTVPRGVRKRLNLQKGDRICFVLDQDGRIYVEPAPKGDADPALGAFLDLIEADIKSHPDRLNAFGGGLRDRLAALVGDVDVDLDAPLSPDDE